MRPYGSPRQLEERRRHAIQLLQGGKKAIEVAEAVGASKSSVSRWQTVYAEKGAIGLVPQPAPGRPSKLSVTQKKKLADTLLKGALSAGYGTDLWTSRRVAQVIQKQFGIPYHPNHLWRLLVGLGWSCQKPVRRAKERDEAAIVRWKRHRWPHIKKGPKTWCPPCVS